MFTEYIDSYVSETNTTKIIVQIFLKNADKHFWKNIDKCFLTCFVPLTLFAPHLIFSFDNDEGDENFGDDNEEDTTQCQIL